MGENLEHRMGFEPMNTGFADQRVSHFATGARAATQDGAAELKANFDYCGWVVVRRYGFTVL